MICAEEEYKTHRESLDRVPLQQFSWPRESAPRPFAGLSARSSPATSVSPARSSVRSGDTAAATSAAESPAQSSAISPAEIEASWAYMEGQLPAALVKRLRDTAWVCTTLQDRMSLDDAQSVISKALEQAEALQTRVLTDNW